MPATTVIYSDISRVRGCTAFAIAEVIEGRPVRYIGGNLQTSATTVASEILALAFAVASCEPTDFVIAYTDIDALPGMYHDGVTPSWQAGAVGRAMRLLRKAAARHGELSVREVDRKNVHYRRCHLIANKRAKRLAGPKPG